jgi:alpha-beta hydrolase superfamily lysophospholipase
MYHAASISRTLVFVALLVGASTTIGQYRAERFGFEYDGLRYAGFIDAPEQGKARGMIVLIPGHGCTSVTDGHTLESHRRELIRQGWATAIWDRAGCGESEGSYDHDQSVHDSAREAVAALNALRAMDAPGVGRLGIWSVSRGGWIAPLAIERDGNVDFWISVSGPSNLENFPYMLETNIVLDGRSRQRARAARDAWLAAQRLVHDPSVSYEKYIERTRAMFEDPWFSRHFDSAPSREAFREAQASAGQDPNRYDPETGTPIAVEGFDATLESLDIPVLALLGDKDSQVDWRRTRDFYRRTLGDDPGTELTLRVLEDCNHAMRVAETGAWREDLSAPGLGERCPDYWPTLRGWLDAHGTSR